VEVDGGLNDPFARLLLSLGSPPQLVSPAGRHFA
jgi:hypothetical protein